MRLQLTIKKPGNLLGIFLKTDISEQQYAQIVLLLSRPDDYQVAPRPRIGFRPLHREKPDAAS